MNAIMGHVADVAKERLGQTTRRLAEILPSFPITPCQILPLLLATQSVNLDLFGTCWHDSTANVVRSLIKNLF